MQAAIAFADEHRNPREAAEEWIESNPHVVALFERFALELAGRNRRFGINLIRERVRWECAFAYEDDFKVCNTHSPYIARHLIAKHPHLAAFVETRATKY